MAYDKVIDSAVLEANLKTVADAIRAKAGTSGSLSFPAGFAEAIAAIEAGGGGASAWGTVTPSSYANSITVGVEIPSDNFYFAVAAVSTTTETSSSYILCGYFVIENGVTRGVMMGMDKKIGAVVNSPQIGSIHIVLDRDSNKITFDTRGGTVTSYLKGGVSYAWFMGGVS
jgi:hypothetical protein